MNLEDIEEQLRRIANMRDDEMRRAIIELKRDIERARLFGAR